MACLIKRLSFLLFVFLLTGGASYSQEKYPILFDDLETMRQFGIEVSFGETPKLPVRCYYYGDGGYPISISNELLNLYKSQGFTENSLFGASQRNSV